MNREPDRRIEDAFRAYISSVRQTWNDLRGESVHSAALANPRERPQIVAIVLMIVIAFAAIVRTRLLDLPLERDEGEYAYAGQLLLQGVPPYSQAYNMKFPGMYVAYAAIMAVFGQTVTAIRLGLLIANAATITKLLPISRIKRRLPSDCSRSAMGAATWTIPAIPPW